MMQIMPRYCNLMIGSWYLIGTWKEIIPLGRTILPWPGARWPGTRQRSPDRESPSAPGLAYGLAHAAAPAGSRRLLPGGLFARASKPAAVPRRERARHLDRPGGVFGGFADGSETQVASGYSLRLRAGTGLRTYRLRRGRAGSACRIRTTAGSVCRHRAIAQPAAHRAQPALPRWSADFRDRRHAGLSGRHRKITFEPRPKPVESRFGPAWRATMSTSDPFDGLLRKALQSA